MFTLAALARAIRAGKISPVAPTRRCLDRIARLDGRLRAFITVDGDRAVAAARERESEQNRGVWRGPLHGVPLAFKDLCFIRGLPPSCGPKMAGYFRAREECATVTPLVDT